MSNKKPVYTITTFKWRALHPSADETRSYLTLAPVIVADNAPVGAAGDAPGGAACDAPASLEPEVSLCAECAPPHHVSSSAPQPLPASPLSPMRALSGMLAADTDMLSELIKESRHDEEARMRMLE